MFCNCVLLCKWHKVTIVHFMLGNWRWPTDPSHYQCLVHIWIHLSVSAIKGNFHHMLLWLFPCFFVIIFHWQFVVTFSLQIFIKLTNVAEWRIIIFRDSDVATFFVSSELENYDLLHEKLFTKKSLALYECYYRMAVMPRCSSNQMTKSAYRLSEDVNITLDLLLITETGLCQKMRT